MTRVAVEMPYIGSVITVNHMYWHQQHRGSFFLRPAAKDWRNALSLLIQNTAFRERWEALPPLKVIVSGQFKDRRSTPDLHNLKLIADAVETATGLNDRHYTMVFLEPVVVKGCSPTIYITIEDAAEAQAQGEPATGAPQTV